MNINEIANLAQVSRATVSRYLNQGYVSEEKKERIKQVIEETGYKPSAQAQMLRTKKTQLIGVILPRISSESVSHMVSGISQVLSKEGFQLLLANTNNDEKQELNYLKIFAENHVDGIILIGTIFTKEHLRLLKELKVPVVILGQRLPGYTSVYYDDYEAAKELTQRLLRKGSQIGYIGATRKDAATGEGRYRGFCAALEEAQVEILPDAMVESPFSIDGGHDCMERLLEQNPELDSIFCATDNIAIGAMTYLQEIGKKIPEEVQLVGFGDTSISRVIIPKLTTVHFYYHTSGAEAAKMLMEALQSEKPVHKELKMGYDIIDRSSVR